MRILSAPFLLISFLLCTAQDYKAEFDAALQSSDTLQQRLILEEWSGAVDSTDAELLVGFFNYYFILGIQEEIVLGMGGLNGPGFTIRDSSGESVGYIASLREPKSDSILQLAFSTIDKAIDIYPSRLDLRFGKIYALGELERWMEFKSEILQLIPFADSIDYEWTWTYHEEKEDAKNFFLSSLQGYQMTLYNTNDDSLLYPMREIALEILKYNPNHVESLSTYALTYIILGEYEPGIEALLKAEELAPTDIIVLNNLAQAYKRNGDTALAIVYYDKILEIGDERDKKMAQSEIDKLKSE